MTSLSCTIACRCIVWHVIFEDIGVIFIDENRLFYECKSNFRYTYTYTYACACACTCTCTYTYTHTLIHIHTHTHTHTYTCLLLLAIFESKGNKLSSSAECRIRTQKGLWNRISSRLNAHWQTDWAIEDQAIKHELDSPSLGSASIQLTRPHCLLVFAPGSGDIHVCCC